MSFGPRKTPMPPRQTRMARGTKPLPKVNPVRQAKRNAERAKKRRAYRKSATYREVAARAGGVCEYVGPVTGRRCTETEFLEHHHLTYARFGCELPNDMVVLCRTHHHYVEATQYSHRRRA